MELQTSRLRLDEASLADLKPIHALHSLPEVDEYNTLGIPTDINETGDLLADWIGQQSATPRASYVFCVRLIENGQFIGLMALKPGKPDYRSGEVWYKTHPAFWRQGYTTEALTALLNFGFGRLGLHRIEAGCAVENAASIRVLEKVGMMGEGRKRGILPIRGTWVDNYFYAVLDSDQRADK